MAMPAADDRARTVTNAVSVMYGINDSHAFQSAMPADDHVALDTPAGAATSRSAVALLIRTDPVATTNPSPARTTRVKSFAARYGQRPVPWTRTDRRVPAP